MFYFDESAPGAKWFMLIREAQKMKNAFDWSFTRLQEEVKKGNYDGARRQLEVIAAGWDVVDGDDGEGRILLSETA